MKFGKSMEIITCVGPKNADYAVLCIRNLLKNAHPERVVVIANNLVLKYIEKKVHDVVVNYLDEDKILPNSTLKLIQGTFTERGLPAKLANWYFQQFLKLQYCYLTRDKEYLIWDSDTILLQPIEFKPNNSQYYLTNGETYFHKPYSEFVRSVLDFEPSNRTFIAQHLFINTSILNEILEKIRIKYNQKYWFNSVIEYLIDNKSVSGKYEENLFFSEFHVYGAYIEKFYSNLYVKRDVAWLRDASYIKKFPKTKDLKKLSKSYVFVAFEVKFNKSQFINLIVLSLKTVRLKLKKCFPFKSK